MDEKNPNWWVSVITLLPFQAGMGVGSSSTGRAGSLCAPCVLLCFYSDTIGFVCSWLCFARQNCWAELVRGEGILSEYLKSETLSDSGEIDSLKQCIACLLHGCFNEVGSLNKTQCLGPKSSLCILWLHTRGVLIVDIFKELHSIKFRKLPKII